MNFGTKVQISHEIPKHRLRFFALCDVIPVSHARACRSGQALSGVFLSAGRQQRGNGVHGRTAQSTQRNRRVQHRLKNVRHRPETGFRPVPESGAGGAGAGLQSHAAGRWQSVHRAVPHALTRYAASRNTVRVETRHAVQDGQRGCLNRHRPRSGRACRGGG